MTSQIIGDFGELTVETESVEVTSLSPRPDKKWRYTDQQGHQHSWDDGYPTLTEVAGETWWCEDCHDEHQDTHLECTQCHEVIVPKTVGPPPYREWIPGRTSYYLNGEPITEDQARALMSRGLS